MKQVRVPVVLIASLVGAMVVVTLTRDERKDAPAAVKAPGEVMSASSADEVKVRQDLHLLPTKAQPSSAALVIDLRLVDMFDENLSAIDEVPLQVIRERVREELALSMSPEVLSLAMNLFERYLNYKHALERDGRQPPPIRFQGNGKGAIEAMRLAASDKSRLRSQYFSAAEIVAMFGRDDSRLADELARLEILHDARLSEQQKQEQMKRLDESMPADLRESRQAPRRIEQLQDEVKRMRADGATDDDVYRMRAAALSPEAAARMSEVDRELAAWKLRIDSYLLERRRLAGNAEAQAQLRDSLFTLEEQARLHAFEE